MRTSPQARAFIRSFEGLRLTAYRDIGGVWTIGYGDTQNVRPGMVITRQEADQRFDRRLAIEFEPGVLSAIGRNATTQNQFDAMVSLAYNIGVRAFRHSSVARLHASQDYRSAADAFLPYHLVRGTASMPLKRRRAAERKLYLTPDPSHTRSE